MGRGRFSMLPRTCFVVHNHFLWLLEDAEHVQWSIEDILGSIEHVLWSAEIGHVELERD